MATSPSSPLKSMSWAAKVHIYVCILLGSFQCHFRLIFSFYFVFLKHFVILRERAWVGWGVAEGEWEAGPSPLRRERNVELHCRTPRWWPEVKADVSHLSHPCASIFLILNSLFVLTIGSFPFFWLQLLITFCPYHLLDYFYYFCHGAVIFMHAPWITLIVC